MYPRPWSIPPRVTKKYENHLRVVFLCVSALDPKPPPNRHLKGRSQMSVNPTKPHCTVYYTVRIYASKSLNLLDF